MIPDPLLWFPALFVLAIVTMPLWARLTNEITGRLIGRVIVICPYCMLPGVVRSTEPEVFR